LLGIVSMLYGYILPSGGKIGTVDLPDLFRFVIYLPLVLFIGSAIDERDIEGISLALKLVVVFNIMAAVALLADIPVVSNALMLIYADAKVNYDYEFMRIGIPFTNPNFAALIFMLCLSYFLFFERSLKFAALSVISLFVTGSRSGWVSAMPLVLLAYVNQLRVISFRNPIHMATFIAFHALFIYNFGKLAETAQGFVRLQELLQSLDGSGSGFFEVETASVRLDIANDVSEYIKRSPWLGWGPARSYGLNVIDSQLLSWSLTFGIPGAIVIAGFFAFLFVNIARRAVRSEQAVAAMVTLMSFFLMLSSGDFMRNYRLFFISVLLIHCMGLIAARRVLSRTRLVAVIS